MRFSRKAFSDILAPFILTWQLILVVQKLRRRSSFAQLSRWSRFKQVDLILKVDGRLTQHVISIQRTTEAVEIHLRPDGLMELAQIDRALVPNNPNGQWPTYVAPPVTEAGVVSVDTIPPPGSTGTYHYHHAA